MFRIFLVEDDEIISKLIKTHLEGWGYEVYTVTDFKTVSEQFNEIRPHLVLLDIMLPFFNGYHWCGEIRKTSKVPIMFISSASDNMNIVMAVNMGGDDFIAKPFDIHIVTAKIQALLRRTYDFATTTDYIEHCGVMLNTGDTTVTYEGAKLELTKNEYRILLTLMENKGKIVSRDTLMERLWETDSYVDENTLTVNVNRLRKSLEDIGLSDYIKTKKGIGYTVG